MGEADKEAAKEEEEEAAAAFARSATTGELRAMVGRAVGVTLEGKYRAPFDKALSKLTAPPPTQPRARRRFKIANKRAKHDETRNA